MEKAKWCPGVSAQHLGLQLPSILQGPHHSPPPLAPPLKLPKIFETSEGGKQHTGIRKPTTHLLSVKYYVWPFPYSTYST